MKKVSKQKLILVVLGISLLFFVFIHFTSTKINLRSTLAANILTINNKTINNIPVMIKIPRIKVNAIVEHVGLTPDGSMDVPKTPEDTAWFDLGTSPGDIGSSVIDGHSGYKDNKPAVFDNLYKLQKGDKIYIEDSRGTTTTFVVREFRNYDPDKDDRNVFISNDGLAHLNLITCNGTWNTTLKTHSSRLVVFSDKVAS